MLGGLAADGASGVDTRSAQESFMRTFTVLAVAALGACSSPAPETPPAPEPAPVPEPVAPPHAATFGALPEAPAADAVATLGKSLYFDARLSVNDTISCNSCHRLDKFGQDSEPTSPGHDGTRGGRNSPTTLNASLQFVQFWDGRAADVEAQALGPVLNPVEMGMADGAAVAAKIKGIAGYGPLFAAAFPGEADAVTFDNIGKAIGAYERTLLTPGRWDRYLGGDLTALTDAEKAGLDTFVATGCTACHSGVLLGGHMYNKIGLVQPYLTTDRGRAEVTGNEADAFFFKVPMLRNIAETGPYFHDGSVATLNDAVTLMARHQLGKELTPEEVTSIVTFLGALTGDVDAAKVAPPMLP
jgi:cytochrome c peroxidase